jgi:hypothetical protein
VQKCADNPAKSGTVGKYVQYKILVSNPSGTAVAIVAAAMAR